MNRRLIVILGLVVAFVFLAAISRIIHRDGKLAATNTTREAYQAAINEGLDVKSVTGRSPYMRTER
jgi:hypothetical protein